MKPAKLIVITLSLVIALPIYCSAAPVTLDFENVGGVIPDGQHVTIGNTSVVIDNVLFQVPGISPPAPPLGEPIYIYGQNGDPFPTKSIGLFTYGPEGMTITFPEPIIEMRFEHGQGAVLTPATFQITAAGFGPFNFTTQRFVPHALNIQFPSLVSSVHFQFVSGTASQLGMDNLMYTVPEPGSAALLALGVGVLLMRRLRWSSKNRQPSSQL